MLHARMPCMSACASAQLLSACPCMCTLVCSSIFSCCAHVPHDDRASVNICVLAVCVLQAGTCHAALKCSTVDYQALVSLCAAHACASMHNLSRVIVVAARYSRQYARFPCTSCLLHMLLATSNDCVCLSTPTPTAANCPFPCTGC